MKLGMLPPFYQIFDKIRPRNVCEIGTHNAKTAVQFVDYCLKINPKLQYYGYDVFDLELHNDEFHKYEINGKGSGSYKLATKNLKHRQKKYPEFYFKLYKGYTQDTLEKNSFDFVYIDGGHSYDTVKHDYEKLYESKVVVFDDYNLPDVKKYVDEMVKDKGLREESFETVLEKGKGFAFLPHQKSKHVQPVIFNLL